ncbi:CheY-like chemotaxis protein [Pontibacter ummariensis]|uniref:CheY chemotaxis protein or a CheY-like REC (Receiver) domain n=1 Tax=Pontibacter ummariensis TaxID=1610492 RepID=A0A239EUU4_9BACT|nr:response regulator [Pontibacter ummariensis]PRY12750.1 CheY-like chemotaxis protein [Pontibacter ummariensis]SNS48058.1 CheY chemotaxis protein or a CheY-like REC (receiver) domain [Pontibacter ummariensis]
MNTLMTPYNYPLGLVLLVDDDDTTNYLNERLLREMQIAREYKVLKNGKEAIEYMRKAYQAEVDPDFPRPDVIFLDIKMPVMDGFSFLEEYQRNDLDASNPVVILMLTSSASFYDLERLKQYNKVKKHYAKALTKHDVREIMNEFFSNKAKA